jgi:hypothetical protein
MPLRKNRNLKEILKDDFELINTVNWNLIYINKVLRGRLKNKEVRLGIKRILIVGSDEQWSLERIYIKYLKHNYRDRLASMLFPANCVA